MSRSKLLTLSDFLTIENLFTGEDKLHTFSSNFAFLRYSDGKLTPTPSLGSNRNSMYKDPTGIRSYNFDKNGRLTEYKESSGYTFSYVYQLEALRSHGYREKIGQGYSALKLYNSVNSLRSYHLYNEKRDNIDVVNISMDHGWYEHNYKYDDGGRLLSKEQFFVSKDTGERHFQYGDTNEYDQSGNLIQSYYRTRGDNSPSLGTKYVYDSDGTLIEEYYQHFERDSQELSVSTVTYYSDIGVTKKIDNLLKTNIDFEYDDKKNVVCITEYGTTKETITKYEYEYSKFDKNGNWNEQTCRVYSGQTDDLKLIETKQYYQQLSYYEKSWWSGFRNLLQN